MCVYLVLHNYITFVDLCDHHCSQDAEKFYYKDPSCYIFTAIVTVLPSFHKPTTKFYNTQTTQQPLGQYVKYCCNFFYTYVMWAGSKVRK